MFHLLHASPSLSPSPPWPGPPQMQNFHGPNSTSGTPSSTSNLCPSFLQASQLLFRLVPVDPVLHCQYLKQ